MKRLRLNFQKGEGGLAGSQFLGEGCWEGGSDFFSGILQFYINNKLKS